MNKKFAHLREMIETCAVKYENNIAFKIKKKDEKYEDLVPYPEIVEKLRDYKKFESNRLFVITQTISLDYLILLGMLDEIKKSKFDYVYIYCFETIYILNLTNRTIIEKKISKSINKILKSYYDNAWIHDCIWIIVFIYENQDFGGYYERNHGKGS